MEGKNFIQRLSLKNILSFGSEGVEIDLLPLNVIIGTNASGKSNLIEAIGLLQAAPKDITAPIAAGGGIEHWLWKNRDTSASSLEDAFLEAKIANLLPSQKDSVLISYELVFSASDDDFFHIFAEIIKNLSPNNAGTPNVEFFYIKDIPQISIATKADPSGKDYVMRDLDFDEIQHSRSILSQKRDIHFYPEITKLAVAFASIKIYRYWNFEPNKPPRNPESNNLSGKFLAEDASNLASVIQELQLKSTKSYEKILAELQQFYPRAKYLSVQSYATTKELFLAEDGLNQAIPAARLSEGTLRYLCLLVILCHPEPPPLICIEEPEIGIHPDLLSNLAQLLIEASQRTQLIVTTQSNMLVSALSEVPESVIVCERDEKGSHLHRLDKASLDEWLSEESLGSVWMRGLIGGTRW